MPRILTAYASRFQRARVWQGEFVRGEKFTLTANFNAVLAAGETIAAVTWYCMNTGSVIFGTVTKGARTTSVVCTMGWGGGSAVKCEVTSSGGSVATQVFGIGVASGPYFQGETVPAQGQSSVTA